jgi:hypothetical protein
MTIAIAASLAGTLGLAGGMLSLDLFFDTHVRKCGGGGASS